MLSEGWWLFLLVPCLPPPSLLPSCHGLRGTALAWCARAFQSTMALTSISFLSILVLKGLQQDSKSSVRCLALQTMLILNACKKHRPARTSLRTLLHRMRLMHTRENPVIEAAQLPE